MAYFVTPSCHYQQRQEGYACDGLAALRAAHRRKTAEREAFVPNSSTMAFLEGVVALKKYTTPRDSVLVPDHMDVIEGGARRISIWYYAPRGGRHFQVLTSWRGRVREGVWSRELRHDVALRDLPKQIRDRLDRAAQKEHEEEAANGSAA